MTEKDNNAAGSWICTCGKANTGKFCVTCGTPCPVPPAPQNPPADGRGAASVNSPALPAEWVCTCGKANTGSFCVICGTPRPAANPGTASQPANGTVMMPPRDNRPIAEGESAVDSARAAQEAAARRAAEEAAARQAAQVRAAQEAMARKEAEAREVSSMPSTKADGNKGMLIKVAIAVAVLLLLIGAYFMFGRKKETPPPPEPPKVETKTETKAETEKPMDPAVKAEKLKAYVEAMKAANAQKKQDATTNEKLVFLVEDVRRTGNDLLIFGHFYNGKKNRTIISVKSMELDIVLRDIDKELLNEKNIKYGQSFTGMDIKPLKDSPQLMITLQGKAPAAEFNNFTVMAHDVHWEAVDGK